MAFRQSYKEKKIDKIKQICNKDNSANIIIKTSPNLALEKIIIINKATSKLEK